jgi:hypothetical protein
MRMVMEWTLSRASKSTYLAMHLEPLAKPFLNVDVESEHHNVSLHVYWI